MAWVMYDTVTVDTVPNNPPAVAGYTAGYWPTYNGLVARYPRAKHLSIAIAAGYDAECLDCEPGDASPAQVPGWVRRQHARGVPKPVVYASVSTMPTVLAELNANGIPRSQVRLWSAHYTFNPHICGPECGYGDFHADATQWTDRALGRNLDESLCLSDFFGTPVKVKPPDPYQILDAGPFPYGKLMLSEKAVCREFDQKSKHKWYYWHRRRVLWTQIKYLRDRVKYEAYKGGKADWGSYARGHRWQLLNDRVKTMKP